MQCSFFFTQFTIMLRCFFILSSLERLNFVVCLVLLCLTYANSYLPLRHLKCVFSDNSMIQPLQILSHKFYKRMSTFKFKQQDNLKF